MRSFLHSTGCIPLIWPPLLAAAAAVGGRLWCPAFRYLAGAVAAAAAAAGAVAAGAAVGRLHPGAGVTSCGRFGFLPY